MIGRRRLLIRTVAAVVMAAALGLVGPPAAHAQAPSGQVTLVYNISIVPRWFDPAESEGLVTPSFSTTRSMTRW